MSIYTMAFMGAAPFGSFLAGSLSSLVGAPNTILFGGVACIIGAAIFYNKLPKIKELVSPIYQDMGILPKKQNIYSFNTYLINDKYNKISKKHKKSSLYKSILKHKFHFDSPFINLSYLFNKHIWHNNYVEAFNLNSKLI